MRWLVLFAGLALTAASAAPIKLSSSSFGNGAAIPSQCTCQGNDLSPPLTWTDAPSDAKSLALIVIDQDATSGPDRHPFVHWIAFNMAPSLRTLPGGVRESTDLALQGMNDFGRMGYAGPCPPSGRHRYMFRIYALDTRIVTTAPLTFAEFTKAVDGHVLGRGELVGTFAKTP
ncbi:YbhB/YbcL family Raf kinase inhibitor-like protein [Pendulispora brunnea]|uniref:YbhB/YbcL family Raf kinase inhibitor-like protein n=1 Tax=Pendulispora brunnea TaxID=2905690 RepID=A0ABZ2KG95_9BACT